MRTKISKDGFFLDYETEGQYHEGPHHIGWQGGPVHFLYSVMDGGREFDDAAEWDAFAEKNEFPTWDELNEELYT